METVGKTFALFKYYFLIILKFQVWNKMYLRSLRSFLLVKKSMLAARKPNSQHICLSSSIEWKLDPLSVCFRVPPKAKNWRKFPNASEPLWPVSFFHGCYRGQRQIHNSSWSVIESTAPHRDNSYSNSCTDWGSVKTGNHNRKFRKAAQSNSCLPTYYKKTDGSSRM